MLTDAQWAMLEPLIEACRPKGKTAPQGSAPHPLGHPLAAPKWSQVAISSGGDGPLVAGGSGLRP